MFKWKTKEEKEELTRKRIIILLSILTVLIFLSIFRFLTEEDTWICQDGAWVKHGKPISEMPEEPCE
ncbi:MAG: hypothetical protein M1355_03225 [Patescibacteria group bacterium]|nr:hypothetical protein [Patescibacteria group bacterium]